MAFIQMDFESQYLGCRNPISILLPDIPRPADPRKFYSENPRVEVIIKMVEVKSEAHG